MTKHITDLSEFGLWKPFGPFSLAVVQEGEVLVHLKGQVPLDINGALVGEEDMDAQVTQTLVNIQNVLRAVGGAMCDIVSVVNYTTDIDSFMSTTPIRNQYFCAPYPVTTTVQVQRLYDPRIMVEITVVAGIQKPMASEGDRNESKS